jgi:hypothetical protein
MSYIEDFLIAIIENKDEDAFGNYGSVLLDEVAGDKYDEIADWLDGRLEFEDVEFTSFVLGEIFPSPGFNKRYNGPEMLFRMFDLNYDDERVYAKASTLLKYNDEIGLPGDWEEKLEKFGWLEDFKANYKKIADLDSLSGFDIDLIKDIIDNQKYDVMNKEQARVLSNLVYYNSSDRNNTFSPSTYPQTRMLNQIAINSDLDSDVMDAIEDGAAGWYAEEIESQLEKVDMADYTIQMKKDARDFKVANMLKPEHVEEYKREWKGVLEFDYREGTIGLEDQVNDYIAISFDGKVVYSDDGKNEQGYYNDFGDTRLRKDIIDKFLGEKGQEYKSATELFLF